MRDLTFSLMRSFRCPVDSCVAAVADCEEHPTNGAVTSVTMFKSKRSLVDGRGASYISIIWWVARRVHDHRNSYEQRPLFVFQLGRERDITVEVRSGCVLGRIGIYLISE